MTESPPTNPADANEETPDDAARSVQEQLDHLLTQIETEEPGTLDPAVLPADFKPQAAEDPPPATDEAADAAEAAEALADFEAALGTEPEASAPAEPAPAEPAPPADDAEAQMLAEINAALNALNPDAEPASDATPPAEAADPADAPGMEAQLADEINALLNAPKEQVAEAADGNAPAGPTEDAPTGDGTEASLEDQLANEIQGLLDATPEAGTEQAEPAPSADGDPSIDELDRILAEEIDEDDELAGDFESVEAITAGIDTGEAEAPPEADEHAASASDVANELDSQPEDLAEQSPEPEGEPETVAAGAARDRDGYEEEELVGWRVRLDAAKEGLLRACFAINWPARRFLSAENRANLGYIALLNLFGAAAVWIYLILF